MLVIDTSVAIKWVVPENGIGMEHDTAAALTLLSRGLLAPDLLLAEFGNVLWKKARKGEITDMQAREAMRTLPEVVTVFPTRPYVVRALEISLTLDHPMYDCVFVALAESRDTKLVTADRRLITRCEKTEFASLITGLETEASQH
ncbi:type II toxin-antitoxin system VapC family toxin [Sphingobium subterraneum]|uniref:Ribonuclease VapC n=1 Tax=Sphingobium subterraneum TaxID=627688 RepID=A0A841IYH4_9SPHN|nr:type II toxin-antitoxin system VapC family toxin [Sphingobium subterraneum]MBB6123182.1 putative nucleic acid-binding protein [Sphingobium subterraneum]